MKKGWNAGSLSSFVTEFIVPQRDKPKKFDGNVPWCRIEDFNGVYLSDTKSNQYVSQETITEMGLKVYPINTVIVSCSADLGRCAIIERPLITNQTFIGLVPGKSLDPKFLYYFMGSVAKLLNEMATGATIKYLSKKKFQDLNCCFPPLPEQQKIVALLDKCFQSIDRAKAIAEKNLQNAKELFESYLNGVFEKGGEDWEENNLGEIADIEYGYTDKAKHDGKYRYIRITDINNEGLLSDIEKVYINSNDESKTFVLTHNDLLMARTGATFAKVLLYEEREPSVFASYLIRIKFNGKVQNKFYWYFSKSPNYWEQAKMLSSGAAQPQFNGNALKQVIFSYPKSLREQQTIVRQLDALRAETQKLENVYQKKISDLEELKKSILQKAFNGELNTEITL